MSIIINVHARQIFDSRGNPTVEVDIITDDGVLGRVKAEERSYARVLRANQWFVHSLLALVRAEVTKRRELLHFLMEDVAEMLHLSRNLFFPHELIN